MKKKQQKVRYKLSNKITEKEMKERINKAFDILFEEMLRRQDNHKD